jgi:N-acylglucosamine 2-epimerase
MLSSLASKYEENLFGSVIPFWMRHSIDREHGGYFTCLDRQGRVFDPRKYVWMNGRQVWTLSRLSNSWERRPEWLEAARLGADFLRRNAFDSDGRCWFSLTADGRPAFFQRKPYAGLFVMLGFHEYGLASGDQWYVERAHELYLDVRRWCRDSSLLGRPVIPGAPRLGELAGIYALCAMGLETGDNAALRECLDQIHLHYDASRELLLECAPLDEESRQYPEARLFCVGSNFEIFWYLMRALDRCPDAGVEAMLYRCLESALEFAWDKEYGGFYYFQDIDARPTLQLESSMKLWWVHAEALYALITAYARTGDAKWLTWLERVDEYVWQRFPDPVHGEWFGYLDRRGDVALDLKGGNYKGCFHIPRALLFSLQTMKTM